MRPERRGRLLRTPTGAAVTSQTRTMMFGLVGTVVTLAGFMLAVVRLA